VTDLHAAILKQLSITPYSLAELTCIGSMSLCDSISRTTSFDEWSILKSTASVSVRELLTRYDNDPIQTKLNHQPIQSEIAILEYL
jgi:hypothetical protein